METVLNLYIQNTSNDKKPLLCPGFFFKTDKSQVCAKFPIQNSDELNRFDISSLINHQYTRCVWEVYNLHRFISSSSMENIQQSFLVNKIYNFCLFLCEIYVHHNMWKEILCQPVQYINCRRKLHSHSCYSFVWWFSNSSL